MRRPTRLQDAALLRAEHFRETIRKGHRYRLRCRPAADGASYTNAAMSPRHKNRASCQRTLSPGH